MKSGVAAGTRQEKKRDGKRDDDWLNWKREEIDDAV